MRVTLTFDNGPDPKGTPAALSALRDCGLAAVFFVVGQKAKANPELVKRIAAAGHVIGNHTWSHSIPFGDASRKGFARNEIERTQQLIEQYSSSLFRPVGSAPGAVIDEHLLNDEAVEVLTDGGYTMALWNVVPRDWEDPLGWMDRAVEGCRETEHAVVVLHDGHPAGMGLLPHFLDALIDDGTEFRVDFPLSCTPISTGLVQPGLAALVAPSPKEYS